MIDGVEIAPLDVSDDGTAEALVAVQRAAYERRGLRTARERVVGAGVELQRP